MPDKDSEEQRGCEEHERAERAYSPRAPLEENLSPIRPYSPKCLELEFSEVHIQDPA
jgi:hypothetical protein